MEQESKPSIPELTKSNHRICKLSIVIERPTNAKIDINFLIQSEKANIGVAKTMQKANALLMDLKFQDM